MNKYTHLSGRGREKRRPERIHPVWQGIGCLLVLVIPVMAYAGAVLLIQANSEQGWLELPPELTRTVVVPVIGSVEALFATLMAAALLALAGYGVLVILYAILYQALAPRDPLDSPPITEDRRSRR